MSKCRMISSVGLVTETVVSTLCRDTFCMAFPLVAVRVHRIHSMQRILDFWAKFKGTGWSDSCEKHGQIRTQPIHPASHLDLRPLKSGDWPTNPTGRADALLAPGISASTAHVGGAVTP